VVTASDDNTTKIWDAATGECTWTLSGHDDYVNSAAYSPDGASVVTASSDKTAKIWDVATGECTLTLSGHNDDVNSAAYSPPYRVGSAGSSTRSFQTARYSVPYFIRNSRLPLLEKHFACYFDGSILE